MDFLYIAYRSKQDIQKEQVLERFLKRVYSAPVEHPIVHWIQENLESIRKNDTTLYYDFPKEKVEIFYNTLLDAHAEKSKESPRPWKLLPIPAAEDYAYPIAQYEKEYGAIYYESLYKYITAIGVILNIFDFEANQLIMYIH